MKRSAKTGRFESEPDAKRFWRKVKKQRGKRCWLWAGSTDKDGYGWFSGFGQVKAHRASFVLHFGAIPKGRHVLHHCDTPSCVKPDHLYTGTNLDNANDRKERGRGKWASGEANGQARLTRSQVARVRRLRSRGLTHQAIADRFGVSRTTITNILSGKTWRIPVGQGSREIVG